MCCDECDEWIHTTCVGLSTETYNNLIGSSVLWFCNKCGVPNYTPDFSDTYISATTSNTYETLGLTRDESLNSSVASISSSISIGSPKLASSPNKHPYKHKAKARKHISVLNVNCQSVSSHRDRFENLIDSTHPDIVIGTESWLHSGIHSSECLPTNQYEVLRRDRGGDDHHGGVFIAYKKDMVAVQVEELETDCEILWCTMSLAGCKALHIVHTTDRMMVMNKASSNFGSHWNASEIDITKLLSLVVTLTSLAGTGKTTQ